MALSARLLFRHVGPVVTVTAGAVDTARTVVAVPVHPLPSVTDTVYVPAVEADAVKPAGSSDDEV